MSNSNKVTLVLGTFFGDEGKGKIIDYLAQKSDVVARATGGNNAGHKVVIAGKAYPLHLLPSGVFNPKATVIIGNGVYVNPVVLVEEIKKIEADGFDVMSRLRISEKAHVIMPYDPIKDKAEESKRVKKIGTTGRGIGPVAEGKYSRDGFRMGDLLCDNLHEFLESDCYSKLQKIHINYTIDYLSEIETIKNLLPAYCEAIEFLKPCVCDTITLIHTAMESGRIVLGEGAQSTLLDVDMGTYPFVTSSNPTAGGMCTGLGIGPTSIGEVIGVLKAYASRVGEGPFITEDLGEDGNRIRELGHEYGTTTGRPRRCGWLDLPALKYAKRVNGLTALAVNHLDTIGNFEHIKVCIAYRNKETDQIVYDFSSEMKELTKYEPIYKIFDGNFGEIGHVRKCKDLPANAINYLQFIANYTGVPIKYVGVGPDREDLIEDELTPEI